MTTISAKLRTVLSASSHQRERLAASLSVSTSTIDRWANDLASPTTRHLRALQSILNEFDNELVSHRVSQQLSTSLVAAREAMHKHGSASSRNDALDQISLILLCQLRLLGMKRDGLEKLDPAQQLNALKALYDEKDLSSIKAAFALPLKTWSDRPQFLAELLSAMSPALSDMGAFQSGKPSSHFHEIFVSFLSSAFHEEKEFAQYMTPREVTDFMTRVGLSLLQEGDSHPVVLDPSCGTGSFLTDFVDLYSLRIEETRGTKARATWLKKTAPGCIVGIDASERMIRLASASFAASGLTPKHLYVDSALQPHTSGASRFLSDSFVDLILTNPPFGAEHSKGAHGGGRIPSELIFLSRYVDWLKPSGVGITIIPDSVLTNKGAFEVARRELLQKVDIIAVISLPPVTFAASGTSTKTSILAFRKKTDAHSSPRTFFAVADDIGFQVSARGSIRKRVKQGRNQLPEIADSLLFNSEHNQIGTWHELTPRCPRWDAQYWNAPISRGDATVKGELSTKIGALAALVNDRIDPRRMPSQSFKYIEISNVDGELLRVSANEIPTADAPSRARQRVRAGDILISTVRPERKTVGVVPASLDGAICSTGFAVLRANQLSPYALATALRSDNVSDQLIGLSSGVAYPVFDAAILPGIEIELLDEQWLSDCSRYGQALEELDALRRCIALA